MNKIKICGFFGKTNKVDKYLARFIKKKMLSQLNSI